MIRSVVNNMNLTLFLLLINDNAPAVPKNFFPYNLYFSAKIFLLLKNLMIFEPKYFIDIIKLLKPWSLKFSIILWLWEYYLFSKVVLEQTLLMDAIKNPLPPAIKNTVLSVFNLIFTFDNINKIFLDLFTTGIWKILYLNNLYNYIHYIYLKNILHFYSLSSIIFKFNFFFYNCSSYIPISNRSNEWFFINNKKI